MRIIHTSDLHIGAPFGARLSAEKIRLRKAELIENFRRLCEEARRIKADAVIIAGDLFDSERVALSVCKRVIDAISSSPEVDFLYLVGNHEKTAFIECGLMMPENLKIFTREWTSFDYPEVRISGRSEVGSNLFSGLDISKDKKNILVLHGAIGEGKSAEELIGLGDAGDLGIDYIALGHYHSYSVTEISRGSVAVYSGTLEGRGFDEVGEKGYSLIDIENGSLTHTFVKFSRRTVRRIEVDTEGIYDRGELEARAAVALSAVPRTDLVRLAVVGKRSPELVIDTSALLARWQDGFFYFEAVDESAIKVNPRDYALDKSLKGEFIRLVSAREDLTEEEKSLIISCGINALMGEFYEV